MGWDRTEAKQSRGSGDGVEAGMGGGGDDESAAYGKEEDEGCKKGPFNVGEGDGDSEEEEGVEHGIE
jgi:hypothetical protein